MKKYFPVILIIILALTIMQQRKKVTNFNKIDYDRIEEDVTNSSGLVDYVDKKGGYSLQHPDDWELSDSSYKNEMIRADIFQGNDIGFQVRLYKNDRKNFKQFVSDYLDQFEQDMVKRWGGELETVKRNFVEERKNVYYRVLYNHNKEEGDEWRYLEYIWNLDDQVLWFQCGFNHEKVPDGITQLDEVAESVLLFN